MALDPDKFLPGEGVVDEAPRRSRRGWWLLAGLAVLAGVLYLGYRQYGGALREGVERAVGGMSDNGSTVDTAANDSAGGAEAMPSGVAMPPVVDDRQAATQEPEPDAPDLPEIVEGSSTQEPEPEQDAPEPDEHSVPTTTGVQGAWQRVEALERAGDMAALRNALQQIAEEHPRDEHGAMARFRLGVLARKQGDKRKAQETWRRVYQELPRTRGGRLAALFLADVWYEAFCGEVPEYEQWEAVRDAYSDALGKDDAPFLAQSVRRRIKERLARLNRRIVFSRQPCRGAEEYVVQKGDRLATIARKFGVHYDSIATINGIRRPQYYIHAGQRLKILKLPAELVVDKSDMTLTLFLGGNWIKEYPVCHGGDKTPTGPFRILNKAADPDWVDPQTGQLYAHDDSRNILGSRWIGLTRGAPGEGIGIHGTTVPSSVPGTSSQGCIRMLNPEVEEVYGFALIDAPVIIRP